MCELRKLIDRLSSCETPDTPGVVVGPAHKDRPLETNVIVKFNGHTGAALHRQWNKIV